MSFDSPPTVSGLVLVSGSQNFDVTTSDFPVLRNMQLVQSSVNAPLLAMSKAAEDITQISQALGKPMTLQLTPVLEPQLSLSSIVVGFPLDMNIIDTEVTTSGVVILEMYFGAGVAYIPPIVIDARIFPVSTASFPVAVSGTRIYPVLPQYSIIIP